MNFQCYVLRSVTKYASFENSPLIKNTGQDPVLDTETDLRKFEKASAISSDELFQRPERQSNSSATEPTTAGDVSLCTIQKTSF